MIALYPVLVYNTDVPPEQRFNGFFVSNLIPVDRQSPVSERQQRKPLIVFLAEHLRDRALPLCGGIMTEQKTIARKWTTQEDEALIRMYEDGVKRNDIAIALGRTQSSVRKRCSVLSLNSRMRRVSNDEIEAIRKWYLDKENSDIDDFHLEELSRILGRTRNYISRLAGYMGLTKESRPLGEKSKREIGEAVKKSQMAKGHPRGMAGKKHTDEFKAFMSEQVRGRVFTPEQIKARVEKRIKTSTEKYGTCRPNWLNSGNAYSRTKSGKRDDLGGQFFRSSWEANYARYLNHLVSVGSILSWRFEPKSFVFEGVVSGVCTYTPDFEVVVSDGCIEWHEVKGWMDENSKIRIARMAEYYPDEKLVVIGRKEYEAIDRAYKQLPNWEQARKVKP